MLQPPSGSLSAAGHRLPTAGSPLAPSSEAVRPAEVVEEGKDLVVDSAVVLPPAMPPRRDEFAEQKIRTGP